MSEAQKPAERLDKAKLGAKDEMIGAAKALSVSNLLHCSNKTGKRQMLVQRKAIRKLAQRIGQEFNPQRVILFGSYAYGKPTEGSDVDLLVVLPFKGSKGRMAVEILRRLRPRKLPPILWTGIDLF